MINPPENLKNPVYPGFLFNYHIKNAFQATQSGGWPLPTYDHVHPNHNYVLQNLLMVHWLKNKDPKGIK